MNPAERSLRVLLLPVPSAPDPWELLLPGAAVAAVVRAEPLETAGPGAPDWLLGFLDWQGLRVPLVRAAITPPPNGPRPGQAHAAVCFAPAADPALPFFAIASPSVPRLERITPATLSAERPEAHPGAVGADRPFIQVALRHLGRPVSLVDLDAVEQALLAALAAG